ncbi:MAG TPA: hypothetical protein VHU18_03005 [Rhizomicrobium sp.]|jgi:hypothetical protein|nr:hypothetical protein [Rhizomicrobium sp.]
MPPSLPDRFRVSNEDGFRKRMARLYDGRLYFYEAMLKADSYDAYCALTGVGRATPRGRKDGPFSAEQEFRYALNRGWICELV